LILSSFYLNFAGYYIINQRFSQLFEFVYLGVDGFDNAVNLRGFGVYIIGDGLLFFMCW